MWRGPLPLGGSMVLRLPWSPQLPLDPFFHPVVEFQQVTDRGKEQGIRFEIADISTKQYESKFFPFPQLGFQHGAGR